MEIYPPRGNETHLIHIKVQLDTRSPVPAGFRFKAPVKGIQWITFAFEYLPSFCFRCGILGHQQFACKLDSWEGGNKSANRRRNKHDYYSTKNWNFIKPNQNCPFSIYPFRANEADFFNGLLMPSVNSLILNEGKLGISGRQANETCIGERNFNNNILKGREGPIIIDITSPEKTNM